MIEGPLHMEQLDLLGQKKLAKMTRDFLQILLCRPGFTPIRLLAMPGDFFRTSQPTAGKSTKRPGRTN